MEETKGYFYSPQKFEYVETEKKYKLDVNFFEVNEEYDKENKIVLAFDGDGEFIEADSQIKLSLTNKTLEETKKESIFTAINFSKKIKEMLKTLICSKEKEEIIFMEDQYVTNAKSIEFLFKLDNLIYIYEIYTENPLKNRLEVLYEDETQSGMVELYNIPSLKGIETYIQNHPKMRVKYVNQLTNINSSKNKSDEVE